MNNSKMINVEAYPNPTMPNNGMPSTYSGNGAKNYPNYLIYGNNGCLQFDPPSKQNNTSSLSSLSAASAASAASALPASPSWNFKSCDSNNPNQQFAINKISTLSQYNIPITSPNNSNHILNDSSNTLLGFYTVNPSSAHDQCLQLNNDGISIMPCNMDSEQRFKPYFHSVN